jgi:hypothetical protein
MLDREEGRERREADVLAHHLMWYDNNRYPLEQFAGRTIDDAKNESFEAVVSVLMARMCLHLSDLTQELSYARGDLAGIGPAVTNAAAGQTAATPYQTPSVDAQDVQNLTKAITQLNQTVSELSPEHRGLRYQVDKPLEVPE